MWERQLLSLSRNLTLLCKTCQHWALMSIAFEILMPLTVDSKMIFFVYRNRVSLTSLLPLRKLCICSPHLKVARLSASIQTDCIPSLKEALPDPSLLTLGISNSLKQCNNPLSVTRSLSGLFSLGASDKLFFGDYHYYQHKGLLVTVLW